MKIALLRTIQILCKFPTNAQRFVRHSSFKVESAEHLKNSGVPKDGIETDTLQNKLEIIQLMRPRHINDFAPLLQLEKSVLRRIAQQAAAEYDTIPGRNRIYYLSSELQIAPVTVAKFCSKFENIFFAAFAGIAKKLKILLDFNVDSAQILQSLYIFRCSEKVLVSRLDQLLKGSFDYKPWYFKLTDEQFRKAISADATKALSFPVESLPKLRSRNLEKSVIVNELNEMLSCEDKVSELIYYDSLDSVEQLPAAKRRIEVLTRIGVELQCIQSNPVVLTLPDAQFNDNIELIKEMLPTSIGDFLPLIEVKTQTLRKFVRNVSKREIDLHPTYLLSRKLKIAPAIVSKYFVKHTRLFLHKDFVTWLTILDILLAYNVDPMSILQSPNTFSLHPDTIESALKALKSHGIENISSWMLVCDKERMEKSAARRVEEKASRGECVDTVDYITKRLNWDHQAQERALKCYPPLVNCSVTKVKAHLDYLLNETHFTVDDINSNVSVLRSNLDELKIRMEELAAIGLVPRKLYSICLYKEAYLGMVWKFCEKKNCPAAFESFRSIAKRIKN